jgi:hypothetical protein
MKKPKHNYPIITIADLNGRMRKMSLIEESLNMKYDYLDKISTYGFHIPLSIQYNNVEIRQSNIHGRGLFATVDLPKNVIVTFYPGHAICSHSDVTINSKLGDFVDEIDLYSDTHNYNISYHNELSIIGNPHDLTNEFLLGHMINDAAGNIFANINLSDASKFKIFSGLVKEYYIRGEKNQNCKYVIDDTETIVSVITTKSIKKNQELLTLYDPIYWFSVSYHDDNDIAVEHMTTLLSNKKFTEWLGKF